MWSLYDLVAEGLTLSILDVGAGIGEQPVYQPLVDAGRARLIGFEPNREHCDALNAQYGPPHRFHPHFVGDGRRATFHETNWSLTGSLFEPNTPLLERFQNLAELTKPVAAHPVDTVRIDDIPEIDDVDLFKIDVQGSEVSVLSNASRALSRAAFVMTEVEFVPLYKGQPLFADVDSLVRGAGFQFHTFASYGGRAFKPMIPNGNVDAPMNQLLWADALYARDWMRLDLLDADKLRKYAVLAHDLFQSFDLAHVVLSELDRRNGSSIAATYLRKLAGG